MNLRTLLLTAALGMSILLTACGGGASGGATGGNASAGPLAIASDGENLAYKPAALTATAGQKVTLSFKNNSGVQQHNWVLAKGGADVADAIDKAGLTAGAGASYIPSDMSNIVAHTSLVNGGETGTVDFTAPAAGTYVFLCTVPGHYPIMQGTLTVN
jgi:azurin